MKLERDVFLYSAYIAQKKYRIVIDEISDRSPVELRALKLLAEFFAYPSKRYDISYAFNTIRLEVSNELYVGNPFCKRIPRSFGPTKMKIITSLLLVPLCICMKNMLKKRYSFYTLMII